VVFVLKPCHIARAHATFLVPCSKGQGYKHLKHGSHRLKLRYRKYIGENTYAHYIPLPSGKNTPGVIWKTLEISRDQRGWKDAAFILVVQATTPDPFCRPSCAVPQAL
jgi:hypothetical protein